MIKLGSALLRHRQTSKNGLHRRVEQIAHRELRKVPFLGTGFGDKSKAVAPSSSSSA
jgi:hypothetical protein